MPAYACMLGVIGHVAAELQKGTLISWTGFVTLQIQDDLKHMCLRLRQEST